MVIVTDSAPIVKGQRLFQILPDFTPIKVQVSRILRRMWRISKAFPGVCFEEILPETAKFSTISRHYERHVSLQFRPNTAI